MTWYTTYWRGSEYLWQDEEASPPLTIGSGLIILGTPNYPGASRWRVVDTWVSYDKHGVFDLGVHVFLELVSDTEDDYPQRLRPDYFVDDPGGTPDDTTSRDW